MPAHKRVTKFDRCVAHVRASRTAASPYAVCQSAVERGNPRPVLTYDLAMAASQDAGNRSMRKAERKVWNEDDYNAAAAEFDRVWPRRNPTDTAAALSEAFHGRPPESSTEYVDALHEHSVLTGLGGLEEIVLKSGLKLRDFAGAQLASNEAGTQLFIVGGDQQVSLKGFGIDSSKESVLLGKIKSLVYRTDKQHLSRADRRSGPYKHTLKPGGHLAYDTVNKKLSFIGGQYFIQVDEDGLSPGIVD